MCVVVEADAVRLLKERTGFSSPPHRIRFYNNTHILGCSSDSMRDLSLLNEHQSALFSHKKLPKGLFSLGEFKTFNFSTTRERDWANILTCHSNSAALWSYANKRIGENALENIHAGVPTTASTSECGNFGVVGFRDGRIEKFNMQSGLHQLSFLAHSEPVVAIATDAYNRTMIRACGAGVVNFWDFRAGVS